MSKWMEELRKLDKLREDSLISKEEYEEQKALLIPSEHSNVTTYNLLGLGKAVSILSGISAAVGLFVLIAFSYRASILTDIKDGKYLSWNDVENADNFVSASLIFEFLIALPLLVLLIIWAWRATSNIEALNRKGRWTSGWAIGGWFTPVMMFFVPYQVVSDAWKNASGEGDVENQRNSFWLVGFILWWVSFAFAFIGNFTGYEIEDGIDDAIVGDVLYAINGGISIISGILIAIAFNQMSKRHARSN